MRFRKDIIVCITLEFMQKFSPFFLFLFHGNFLLVYTMDYEKVFLPLKVSPFDVKIIIRYSGVGSVCVETSLTLRRRV